MDNLDRKAMKAILAILLSSFVLSFFTGTHISTIYKALRYEPTETEDSIDGQLNTVAIRSDVKDLPIVNEQWFDSIAPKPELFRLVYDHADVLPHNDELFLESVLRNFEDSTSTQILVITVTHLADLTSAEYATAIGNDWGVGTAEKDNGVVILVKPKPSLGTGDAFIAPGYGLEGALPDIRCS